MIIEQIRYFAGDEQRGQVIEARREITRIRRELGVPSGRVLVGDTDAEGAPCVVWQCGYDDESEMGMSETRLIGNPEYEAAREQLGQLTARVELELYTADE